MRGNGKTTLKMEKGLSGTRMGTSIEGGGKMGKNKEKEYIKSPMDIAMMVIGRQENIMVLEYKSTKMERNLRGIFGTD